MRNRKGTVYEGGIRVPCFVQWKGHLDAKDVDVPAAHIDLGPTVLEACGCRFRRRSRSTAAACCRFGR